jgi:Tfp pilus assembly protein PilO
MSKVASNPTSAWTLTAVPTVAVVAYLTLVWLPGHRAIVAVQEQVESKRQFVARAAELPAALAGCRRELQTAEAAVARWENAAPRKRHLAEYFEKINVAAKDAGLTIARFDPQPLLVHERIHEIPVVIDGSGGFFQLYEFLRNVERLPPTTWVESITMDSNKSDPKNVTYKVNVVGFGENP